MRPYHILQTGARTHGLPVRGIVKGLYNTAKPGIVGLTLVAALTGIYVGTRGVFPGWEKIAWLFATLALATAGACMLNNFWDQDIDRLMGRTHKRALAAGTVPPRLALAVGLLLSTVPVAVMAVTVNALAALLTAAAVFGYVVIYTMIAKRRTPWANQLGGIAGALPPVIGCAAATGSVDAGAWVLFAIMAVWQQPHALSLSLKYRDDYARARVPVFPVVKGVGATKLRIAVHAAILLPVTLLPAALGMVGVIYLATALLTGTLFLTMCLRFLWSTRDCDLRLFFFSLIHFVALFGSLVWDIRPLGNM